MVEKIVHEATRQPELFSTGNLRIALQARLILGAEALNPNKKDLPAVSQESLTEISSSTYGKLNTASTSERDQYWKEKSSGNTDLQEFDNQYLAWKENVVNFVNSPKDKNRIQTLSHLSALGVDWQNFSDQEVEKIYQRYFKNQPKTASNIQSFVDDIITSYNGDYHAIKSDLVTIKKLANIFGGNSAELVEAAIEAQSKLRAPEKKQELITQVNETKDVNHSPTTRLNWLNADEDRLLRWLSGDTPLPPDPKPVSALTPELAYDNPDFFTKNLLENIRNTNPRLYKIWEFACQKGVVLPDNLRIDPNTWRSEYNRGNITLGTAPMSKEAKYRILFDDQKFNYQDEVIYRLSHEMSHGLLYYVAESMGQKNAFNYLLKTVVDLNNQKGKVFTALASQGYYRRQGAETQGREDMTELINMYILDPNYLKRYLNFLANDSYTNLREKYGLVNIDEDVAQALYNQVEQGLNPLFEDMAIPERKPIRVTPEQNLSAALTFCHNLREQVKNGRMIKRGDSLYEFTDPQSEISIQASSKKAVDKAWTTASTFTEWADRHNLPLVIWYQGDTAHFTLLLKGPEKQYDGKYKVLIYNPFQDKEEYEEVPINEEFDEFRKRELPKLRYDPHSEKYQIDEHSYVLKNHIDRYLFSQWFKLPAHRTYTANNQAIKKLLSKTEPYNLSIDEDPKLPWELKVGKGQRMQFNGYDCGPLAFYTAVLRYAALPEKEEEKKKLVENFADHFGVRILTRQELLGKP